MSLDTALGTEDATYPIVVNERPRDEAVSFGGPRYATVLMPAAMTRTRSLPVRPWLEALTGSPDTPQLAEMRLLRSKSRRDMPAVGEWSRSNENDLATWVRAWEWSRLDHRAGADGVPRVDGLETYLAKESIAWRLVSGAAGELRRRFPGRLELRVDRFEYSDGCGPDEGELLLVISTELDGVAAHDRLEAFMEEYWLDRMQAHPGLPIPSLELL